MAAKYEVYKCEECGNVVMLLNVGGGTLVCCGQDMVLMNEQTADSSTEKHVPIIEKDSDGYSVTVGSTLHPMVEKHWIQWIELIVDGKRMMKELQPGDEPKAHFCLACEEPKSISAREYCNIHGLWRGEK
ncbi:MAG: desulfoferrodoxin [Spirochaetaceae bacterium]|nr:desulfoferrodoxin [Spirochaetaceae bacterium]MDT8298118.1 desulfoferrodoxin [Spirochaetaceae bacterium]